MAQSTPCQNLMDSRILHSPARLASPVVSLQDFLTELAISFMGKLQTGPSPADLNQSVTCTSSSSCFRCGFGRPMATLIRQGDRASLLLVSKLIPASKSAQTISTQ